MKKHIRFWIYSLLVVGAFLMLTNSCKKDEDNNNPIIGGTVKDIDGNVYKTVTIGTQVWMTENLKTTKYRNGDQLPAITDNKQWSNLTSGAQCDYNNDPSIGLKYGKLYNWYAVNDSRKIAPSGWHIASDEEWTVLINYVSDNYGYSGWVAKALASTTNWGSSTEKDAIGNDLTKNNSSGFTAPPSGMRNQNGDYSVMGYHFRCWSSQEDDLYDAWFMELHYSANYIYKNHNSKGNGCSVRCIKD